MCLGTSSQPGPHGAGLPIGGWPCLEPPLFLNTSHSPSQHGAVPHPRSGPIATISLGPSLLHLRASALARLAGVVGRTPGPLPAFSWGVVFSTAGAVAAPWKGVFVSCGERCDQSGKNKQVRRNRYPPPILKIQHMHFAFSFCTNPAA